MERKQTLRKMIKTDFFDKIYRTVVASTFSNISLSEVVKWQSTSMGIDEQQGAQSHPTLFHPVVPETTRNSLDFIIVWPSLGCRIKHCTPTVCMSVRPVPPIFSKL